MARIILLDRDELEPDGEGYCQIILAAPLAAVAGDRFVVRSSSPVTTIGGGMIVDPLPAKHKRSAEAVVAEFRILAGGDQAARAAVVMARAGLGGIRESSLVVRTGIRRAELRRLLEGMFSARTAYLVDRDEARVLSGPVYADLLERISGNWRCTQTVSPQGGALPGGAPDDAGDGRRGRAEDLRMASGSSKSAEGLSPRRSMSGWRGIRSTSRGRWGTSGETRRPVSESGLAPPTLKEALERFPDRKKEIASLIRVMTQEGELVRISEDLNFHRDALATLREEYRKLLVRDGKATPASFRELTGLSRKFIIPLMEYFDMTKLTIRAGEQRILRERQDK